MVGVPRSKGCRTCVQRRVRCDLNKPVCNNCKKGNRDCLFTDDLKFQDEGAKLRRRYAKRAAAEKDQSESPPFIVESLASQSSSESPDSNQWADAIPIAETWSDGEQWPSSNDVSRTSTPLPQGITFPHRNAFFALLESNKQFTYDENAMLDQSEDYVDPFQKIINMDDGIPGLSFNRILLSPAIAQEQLIDMFCSSMTPRGQLQARNTPMPLRSHGRWLSVLPSLTGRSQLLDSAIRAVSLAHMGRLYGDEMFMQESRPYYGKAIRQLNAALSDSEKGLAVETLSATVLMSFYEMFASNSNDAWIRHAGGAGALMRIRGPRVHRYGFDREIFLACRHTVIIECFHRDEPCFLNDPEWIEVSRDIHSDMCEGVENKDTLELFNLAETFYEEMLKIPALLYDARNFKIAFKRERANFPNPRDFKQELLRRVVNSRSNLKMFFARMEACLTNLDFSWTSYASDDPIITRFYTFPNIFVGSTCTGYWTVLVILNFVLIEIQRENAPEKENLYKMENRECALEICRSTPYMLTSSFIGPFFNIFGLRVCLVCLESSEERDWVVRKLFEIGETHMAMASHIPGHHPGVGMPKVRASLNSAGQIREMEHKINSVQGEMPSEKAAMGGVQTGGQYLGLK